MKASTIAISAFVLAVATAIGLGVGFGITISDLQAASSTDRSLLVAAQVQAAQQQAILAELLFVPPPIRIILQTGVYNFFLDWGLGFIGEEMPFRIVDLGNVAVFELDLPVNVSWTLVPGAPYYTMYAVNFSPEVIFTPPPYMFLTKQNRERIIVSSGCLTNGDCTLLGEDQNMNLVPNLLRINANPFFIDTFTLSGTGLSGQTVSFNGTWVIPIPSF